MVESSLKKANLQGTNLSNTDLSFVNFSGCIYDSETVFDDCLYQAGYGLPSAEDIYSALRDVAIWVGPGANLEGCDLSNADLSGANLSRANLNQANLNGSNLVFCKHHA